MKRSTALAVAVLLFASALGYWGVSAYRKGQQQKAVSALVVDASRRLESALALETEASAASGQQTVGKLDEQAQEVDRHVMELHDMGVGLNAALNSAADDYLLTVRQILRQQAASYRYRLQVAASETALREHMGAAGRRSGAWINEAVRMKDRLERNYFDYRVSAEALDRLLAAYPASRKKMVAQLGMPLLADEAVEDARRRSAATLKRVSASVEQARQLAAVR
jgi:hypothetical protein